MSNAVGRKKALERHGFKALDEAVVRTLKELKSFRQRALEAERRSAELEALLPTHAIAQGGEVTVLERGRSDFRFV